MEIIPAIDIIEGKCVRLIQGDYNQKKEYNQNPLEVAKAFEDAGIRRLHLVDLDGARQKKIANLKVLENLASNTGLFIDFGGGVQSNEDIEIAFNAGARQITGGSIAVKNPEMFLDWLEQYGSEKIILGADTRNGKIAISGWQENIDVNLTDFLHNYLTQKVKYVICTDVTRDGLLQGPAIELYESLLQNFPQLQIIASGGVSGEKDLHELKKTGVYGVIIGKALYEQRITLEALQAFL